jgi:hypothetical protein
MVPNFCLGIGYPMGSGTDGKIGISDPMHQSPDANFTIRLVSVSVPDPILTIKSYQEIG